MASPSTADKKITLTLKEFLGIAAFILSIGISVGGFIKVLHKVGELSDQIQSLEGKFDTLNTLDTKIATDNEWIKNSLKDLKDDLEKVAESKNQNN